MEKRNSQLEGANKKLVLHVRLRYGSLSITTPVSHLANEFDVRSELQGQMRLAAVNQILSNSRGYERFQKSEDSLKDCFLDLNITISKSTQIGKNTLLERQMTTMFCFIIQERYSIFGLFMES